MTIEQTAETTCEFCGRTIENGELVATITRGHAEASDEFPEEWGLVNDCTGDEYQMCAHCTNRIFDMRDNGAFDPEAK